MTKIYDGLIPFCKKPNGNTYELSSYGANVSRFRRNEGVEKNNVKFLCQLKIGGYSRGRSSATFEAILQGVICEDNKDYGVFLEGCEVSIMMNDINKIITEMNIDKGITNYGVFAFCKRGTNYGLMLIESLGA